MTIDGVVLAAGASRRMGKANKLLMPIDGTPMIRHIVASALASKLRSCIVVTGFESARVESVLEGLATDIEHNSEWQEGMASSIRVGVRALPSDSAACVVLLGDMPGLSPHHIDMIVSSFEADPRRRIQVPRSGGQRGNPLLWPQRHYQQLLALRGDKGARDLLQQHAHAWVDMEDTAVLDDIDSITTT